MSAASPRRTALFAAVVVHALVLATAGTTSASAALPPAATDAMAQFEVSPTLGSLDALAQRLLADGYDVDGARRGTLYLHAPLAAAAALAARNDLTVRAQQVLSAATDQAAPADQDTILPARLDGNEYETFYGGYRTNDAFTQFLADLEAAYPSLVRVVDYGQSYTGANPLQVACVTADADRGCQLRPDVAKARFLLIAQLHARELTTSEMAWRTLTSLVDGYGSDADLTALLSTTEFWVAAQANPDGIEVVQTGIEEDGLTRKSGAWQRKNLNPGTRPCVGVPQIGVDLNRNFDTNWGGVGSGTNECGEIYQGTSPASEPETEGLQDLLRTLFRDQRGADPSDPAPPTTTGAMLSLHSHSNLVLFPYGDERHTPNDTGLRSMAFRMSHYNGYSTGESDEVLYAVSGTTDDYAYEHLGIAAFVYEIGPVTGVCGGFHPPYRCQNRFWGDNKDALFYGAKAARQPYTMALGPTVTRAAASATSTWQATVTASADDDALGLYGVNRPDAQPVVAGRLFVGGPPGAGGQSRPMTVVGSGTSVSLKASLPRTADEQLVYVQARDADGNWGPIRAVWVPGQA